MRESKRTPDMTPSGTTLSKLCNLRTLCHVNSNSGRFGGTLSRPPTEAWDTRNNTHKRRTRYAEIQVGNRVAVPLGDAAVSGSRPGGAARRQGCGNVDYDDGGPGRRRGWWPGR